MCTVLVIIYIYMMSVSDLSVLKSKGALSSSLEFIFRYVFILWFKHVTNCAQIWYEGPH